jgi:hypothetical protein
MQKCENFATKVTQRHRGLVLKYLGNISDPMDERLTAVHRVQELQCRDIYHRINSDCQTRARRLARHANTLEGPRALVELEDHGLADASRPTHARAPAWGQPRRIPVL